MRQPLIRLSGTATYDILDLNRLSSIEIRLSATFRGLAGKTLTAGLYRLNGCGRDKLRFTSAIH